MENDRQTYLYLDADNGYGLPRGGSHPWESSFCIHMAAGTAPTIAPDAQRIPLYAAAAVNEAVTIGSYAGAVITEPEGALFGAICGIDPQVRTDDPALQAAGPILQMLGQLLTMVLAANRARQQAVQAIALAQAEADTDTLTGLLNRRGWERAVASAGALFEEYGDPTIVGMVDLDRLKVINDEQGHDAGDAYIRAACAALRASVRPNDVVARLGGDEFGLILIGCTERIAIDRVERLYTDLARHGVAGSVGWAPISVLRGFPAALAEADEAMYAAKRQRRAARRADVPAIPLVQDDAGCR